MADFAVVVVGGGGGGGGACRWEQETAVFLGQAWGRGAREGLGEKWGREWLGILVWVLALAAEMEAMGVGENL